MAVADHPTWAAYFENEHINLDDKEWLMCTFKNCTFSASKPIVFRGCVVLKSPDIDEKTYRWMFGCAKPMGLGTTVVQLSDFRR